MGKIKKDIINSVPVENWTRAESKTILQKLQKDYNYRQQMFKIASKELEEKFNDSDITYKLSVLPSKKDYEDDKSKPIDQTFEEYKRAKISEGVEGRIEEKYKQEFKDALGYTCKGCGKNYEKNKHKIELHHLVPYSDLKAGDERILTIKDFTVLCVKCHKAIHQLKDISDIKQLRKWNKKSPNYNVLLEKDGNGY